MSFVEAVGEQVARQAGQQQVGAEACVGCTSLLQQQSDVSVDECSRCRDGFQC